MSQSSSGRGPCPGALRFWSPGLTNPNQRPFSPTLPVPMATEIGAEPLEVFEAPQCPGHRTCSTGALPGAILQVRIPHSSPCPFIPTEPMKGRKGFPRSTRRGSAPPGREFRQPGATPRVAGSENSPRPEEPEFRVAPRALALGASAEALLGAVRTGDGVPGLLRRADGLQKPRHVDQPAQSGASNGRIRS